MPVKKRNSFIVLAAAISMAACGAMGCSSLSANDGVASSRAEDAARRAEIAAASAMEAAQRADEAARRLEQKATAP